VDVSPQSGDIFTQRWAARGRTVGDTDNDGRLDVVITSNDGQAYVLRNETSTHNHWITLKLVGVKSNRDDIGAQVEIATSTGKQYANGHDRQRYESSSDPRVHFGLGNAEAVNLIRIRWPSGVIQTLNDVKADQFLAVTEQAPRAK
jgi:hypothetical protein